MSPIVKVTIYTMKFLGMVIQTKDTVVGFFQSLWRQLKSYLVPLNQHWSHFISLQWKLTPAVQSGLMCDATQADLIHKVQMYQTVAKTLHDKDRSYPLISFMFSPLRHPIFFLH